MKLTKGTILKLKGGWDAEVVWMGICAFYAVHKPALGPMASALMCHFENGKAIALLTVNDPPSYNGHPADLEMGEYEL